MDKIIENIKNIMSAKEMSIRELSRSTGISPATISRYINNGSSRIKTSQLSKIAAALHTTPIDLMGYDDKEKEDRHFTDLQRQVVDYVVSLPEEKLEALYEFLRKM